MIYVGENKAILYKGDFRPAQLYKGETKIAGYAETNFEGASGITLENCYNDKVYDAQIRSKNLLDVKKVYPDLANDENGITVSNSNFSKITGHMFTGWKENTQYTFSAEYEITNADNNSFFVRVKYVGENAVSLWNSMGGTVTGDKSGSCLVVTEKDKTVEYMIFSYSTSGRKYNAKVTNMQLEEGTTATEYESPCRNATIIARGKNYFDLDKVPFNNSSTQPYNNGLMTKKISGANRGNKIPISLPVGKIIYVTMEVVNSQIDGTANRVTMGFFDKSDAVVGEIDVSSTIAHKTYAVTLSEEVSYIQFYFQSNNESNAVGDYITMDNIMFRCEGDDAYEPYVEAKTIPFENGDFAEEIPTFRGTTVIEIESDISSKIIGKYKRMEG